MRIREKQKYQKGKKKPGELRLRQKLEIVSTAALGFGELIWKPGHVYRKFLSKSKQV